MSEHRPKTAALLAYSEGLLSDAGRRRVNAHLTGCPSCRRELAAIELYEQMIDDVRDAETPPVEFDRMELALAREARRVSGRVRASATRRRWGPWVAAAIAAAAILGLYLAQPEPTPPPPRASRTPRPVAPPPPAPVAVAYLDPVVTLVAGTLQRLDDNGAASPLGPGDVLAEGDRVETLEDSVAHVRLHAGTGFVAEAGTRVVLERARLDAVRLALGQGRLSSEVRRLESGSRFVILAGGHRVTVTGTRFAVSYLEGVVAVDVAEGQVVVRTPDDERITLDAPARWSSAGAVGGGRPRVGAPRHVESPEEPGAVVTLAHPELVRWEVDGTRVESHAPARLHLREGEHAVRGWTASGRLYTATLPVGTEPTMLDEGALVTEGPRLRPGHLEPDVIRGVVRRGQRYLTQCYEASLRQHQSAITGRVSLRVTVGVVGDVERVQVRDLEGEGADALRTCIANYVRRWTFPPPGGPVSFEVPLNLAPTMR